MKKILTLPVLLFLLISSVNSDGQAYQTFPSDSASWKIVRCFYFYQAGWHDEYTLTMDGTDTIYGGQAFKKLFISNHHTPGAVNDTVYPTAFFGGFKEESRQVYMFKVWASPDTSIKLIYDFNDTAVGDTIHTQVLTGNPNFFGHLITGKDSVLVGSEYHVRLHLQDPNSSFNTEDWIEGVGSSWGLPFATFWSATDNSYDLTCFIEKQSLVYSNPQPNYIYCQPPYPVIVCDSGVTTANKNMTSQVVPMKLYPNPASEYVFVGDINPANKEVTINIYTALGTLIRSESRKDNDLQISTNTLNKGVYFIEILTNNASQRGKLIIQ